MQANSTTIHLNLKEQRKHLPALPDYRVHPVVIISILDHFQRRPRKTDTKQIVPTERVIGCLLGKVERDNVFVTNCFPIPHQENENEVALEVEYMDQMEEFHKDMNPDELIVGWYATGTKINYVNGVVHRAIAGRAEASGYTHAPILLQVDTTMRDAHLNYQGFVVTPVNLPESNADGPMDNLDDQYAMDERELIYQFREVPLELVASEAERIGIDTLIKGKPIDPARFDSPADMKGDMEQLESQLVDLQLMIEEIEEYVDSVVKGKTEPNVEVGFMIANALQSVPDLDPKHYQRVFSTATKDLLMSLYVTQLTQVQVSIANKMNGILAAGRQN